MTTPPDACPHCRVRAAEAFRKAWKQCRSLTVSKVEADLLSEEIEWLRYNLNSLGVGCEFTEEARAHWRENRERLLALRTEH